MHRFNEDEGLRKLREKFYTGDLVEKPKLSRDHKIEVSRPLTPEMMMHRIDARIRRVVVRALENSFPASQVVNSLESFLVATYEQHENDDCSQHADSNWWKDLLIEAPTVTKHSDDGSIKSIKFSFDASSSTGGFHRLLLSGLGQFHGLEAKSSTTPTARSLSVTGTNFSGANVKLAEEVAKRQNAPKRPTPPVSAGKISTGGNSVDALTSRLASVQV